MKKTRAPKGSSARKTKLAPSTVEAYIAGVPEPARNNFEKLRAAVRSAVPADAVEVISYRIPAFKRDRILVWFAAFAKHCSLFPTASVLAKFSNELKEFSTSKGTVQFPNDKPLPADVVKKLVKARVQSSR